MELKLMLVLLLVTVGMAQVSARGFLRTAERSHEEIVVTIDIVAQCNFWYTSYLHGLDGAGALDCICDIAGIDKGTCEELKGPGGDGCTFWINPSIEDVCVKSAIDYTMDYPFNVDLKKVLGCVFEIYGAGEADKRSDNMYGYGRRELLMKNMKKMNDKMKNGPDVSKIPKEDELESILNALKNQK